MFARIIVTVLLAMPFCLCAQRHLQGMKEIRISGGITKLGFYGAGGFGYNLKPKLSIGGDLNYEVGKNAGVAVSTALLNVGIGYNPFHLNETLYVNLLMGIAGAYSTLDDVSSFKEGTEQSGINIGGYVGPELDLYLSDRIMLTAHYKQFYLPMKYMGTSIYLIGGGFKISIH